MGARRSSFSLGKQEQFFFALSTSMASRVVKAEGRDQNFEGIQMAALWGDLGTQISVGTFLLLV